MIDIFRNESTAIRRDEECIVISQGSVDECIPVNQLQTVAELSPSVTMGKYLDVRVVVIQAVARMPIFIPVSRDGAKKILRAIQQCKLDAARQRQTS